MDSKTQLNIIFINRSDFNKNTTADYGGYVFIYYKDVNEKKIINMIHRWTEKYTSFGTILSSLGILIDCSKYDFTIKEKTTLENDLYYQSISNGIIAIRNEYVNNYI